MTTLSPEDTHFLQIVIRMSLEARQAGKHPFAAIVVDASGVLLAQAINDALPPDGDPTRHAELIAAGRATHAAAREQLADATLYTSAEPCAMCAGAIYWCGIGRVVYALSETRLLTLTGNHPENPTLALPCRDVFARGQRRIAVAGPALEDDAAAAHHGFWSAPR
ncbi:nucleoside deaminase [Paludibacterium yongneupense]|uniref:nucleoside deaminase n=1 Tax=Paludibacterium yongneupense TaxID=400061 RepID=UPI0004038ADC|nr:nucleoside deaminase [Paludibacterium yongneupense]